MTIRLVLAGLLGYLFLMIFSTPALAFDPLAGPCGSGGGSSVCLESSSQNPVVNTIKAAAKIVSIIAGIAAVIMIIIGGLNYITSGGDINKAKSARSKIIYSLVGLVIIALAYTITNFLVDKLL